MNRSSNPHLQSSRIRTVLGSKIGHHNRVLRQNFNICCSNWKGSTHRKCQKTEGTVIVIMRETGSTFISFLCVVVIGIGIHLCADTAEYNNKIAVLEYWAILDSRRPESYPFLVSVSFEYMSMWMEISHCSPKMLSHVLIFNRPSSLIFVLQHICTHSISTARVGSTSLSCFVHQTIASSKYCGWPAQHRTLRHSCVRKIPSRQRSICQSTTHLNPSWLCLAGRARKSIPVRISLSETVSRIIF